MRDLKGKVGRLLCPDAKVIPGEDGDGFLEGYLAVFNNIDHAEDRILPGAFTKTVRERVPLGLVPLMAKHFLYGGDIEDTVGIISQAREDSFGLWVHGDYLSDSGSQEIRGKVSSARGKGLRVGLSIGYRVIRCSVSQEGDDLINNLQELELREGTITLRPSNDWAGVTISKSAFDGLDRNELEEMLAAQLGVAKSTVSTALSALVKDTDPNSAVITLGCKGELGVAGLAALEAELRRQRIYIERMRTV